MRRIEAITQDPPRGPAAQAAPSWVGQAVTGLGAALGEPYRWFDSVESTNDVARDWAKDDAPHGALVLADEQTNGRGRLGRSWHTPPGSALALSFVLRLRRAHTHGGRIGMAAALAVARVAEDLTSERATVKWPNDLRMDGRKLSGILMERAGASDAVVLGIGINVTRAASAGVDGATSLEEVAGRAHDRGDVLSALVRHLSALLPLVEETRAATLRTLYESRLDGLHERVALWRTRDHAPATGRMLGVSDDGALRLELADGIRLFHAGDVTFRSPEP